MSNKLFLIIIFFSLISFSLTSLSAVFSSVEGKVEIDRGQGWTAVEAGTVLEGPVLISTSFRSYATLKLGDTETYLHIDPLTRISLDELIQSEGEQTTSFNLRIGKVRAEVERTQEVNHTFTLRSPVSTASVRGTSFSFDGNSLHVREGAVLFFNSLNRQRMVSGGSSKTDGIVISSPQDEYESEFSANQLSTALGSVSSPAQNGETGLILNIEIAQ